jgi:hypothetical protein
MTTTWNILVSVIPKKGKEQLVEDVLNDSEVLECELDKDEWTDSKGNKKVEFTKDCKEETASYDWGVRLPQLLIDKIGKHIEEGQLFMKEVEPSSFPFPADVKVDLVTMLREDRLNKVRLSRMLESTI